MNIQKGFLLKCIRPNFSLHQHSQLYLHEDQIKFIRKKKSILKFKVEKQMEKRVYNDRQLIHSNIFLAKSRNKWIM